MRPTAERYTDDHRIEQVLRDWDNGYAGSDDQLTQEAPAIIRQLLAERKALAGALTACVAALTCSATHASFCDCLDYGAALAQAKAALEAAGL